MREAAEKGANIILLQELFETPYFCQKQKFDYFNLATPLEEKCGGKAVSERCKGAFRCPSNQLL